MSLAIDLRPYQQEVVDKFADKINVLDCDDMGLGKTYSAIALDDVRRQQIPKGYIGAPTLVIAPLTGVVDAWVRSIQTANPALAVRRINEKKRNELFQGYADVYVIHWQAVSLMLDELAANKWLHIIADEAHKLKNRNTGWTKDLKKIKKVAFKTALTGTPVINQPAEPWSILNWLYKDSKQRRAVFGDGQQEDWGKYLTSYWRFYKRYVDYYEDDYGYKHINGPKNEAELMHHIEPIYIRRKKEDVLPDLPDKQYRRIEVDLTPKQRKMYDEVKEDMITWLDSGQPLMTPNVISQLIRLQQFALATCEFDPQGQIQLHAPSAKLDYLMELCESTDRQLIIFSQFSRMVNLVEASMKKAGMSYAKLTGDVSQTTRTVGIDEFHRGNRQFFIATIGAGGVGIDGLQVAQTAVFLDRDWSPGLNSQAEDRIHRLGQKGKVEIVDIVAHKTVDVYRQNRLKMKHSWIKQMLEGAI